MIQSVLSVNNLSIERIRISLANVAKITDDKIFKISYMNIYCCTILLLNPNLAPGRLDSLVIIYLEFTYYKFHKQQLPYDRRNSEELTTLQGKELMIVLLFPIPTDIDVYDIRSRGLMWSERRKQAIST